MAILELLTKESWRIVVKEEPEKGREGLYTTFWAEQSKPSQTLEIFPLFWSREKQKTPWNTQSMILILAIRRSPYTASGC
jgi:hypothetical protein